MVDPETVRRRLREIDKRVAELREVALEGRDRYRSDSRLQAIAERNLQVALQAVIDIALHILAEDTAETPEDYGSALDLLGRHSIIDPDLATRLRSGAGLRNILVHAYTSIDHDRVWSALGSVDDLVVYAQAIERYLPA